MNKLVDRMRNAVHFSCQVVDLGRKGNKDMTEVQGYAIQHIEETTSTNQVCMDLGRDGQAGNYVLVADKQTAGRGRLGRDWESKSGEGIYMSILERPEFDTSKAPMLSIIMGLAARKVIEEDTGMKCSLKWPNDLVYNGKKVAGILAQMKTKPVAIADTETAMPIIQVDYVVVGIGINLLQESFDGELADKATSLRIEGYCNHDDKEIKSKLIQNLVISWKEYYDRFLRVGDLESFIQEYHAHLVNMNKVVRIHDSHEEYTGIALGINSEGELLVKTEEGTQVVNSGEVSVRGVYGYAE